MANELLKAGIKLGAALAALTFGCKVAKEGKKNLQDWMDSQKKEESEPDSQ